MERMAKVKWVENGTGTVREVSVPGGALEALEFAQNAGLKGAKFSSYGDEWTDVDSFMEAGREMFAPISEEEAARREAEWMAQWPDGIIRLTLIDADGNVVE